MKIPEDIRYPIKVLFDDELSFFAHVTNPALPGTYVSVKQNKFESDKWLPPIINWPGVEVTTIEEAISFAHLVIIASNVASELKHRLD
jgi:hypothetical protein